MSDGLALLLRALQTGGLEIDVEAALDSVWLALRMREQELAGDGTSTASTTGAYATAETRAAGAQGGQGRATSTRDAERERRVTKTGQVMKQAAATQPDIGAPARSLTLPRAAALPESRELIRALRPLRRRVVSPGQGLLDIDTTVQRAAEEDLWIPAFAAARERWLDVLLVADHGLSMIIWKDTIDEFERVLRNAGAFRSVRSWWLESDATVAVTARGRGPRPDTPEHLTRLVRGAGRSVVLLISDCVGDRWHDGAIPRLIARWSRQLPTALMQVTPEWFWARTALGETVGSRFRSAVPAMVNHRFRWDAGALSSGGVTPVEAESFLRVPTTTLTPDAVARVAGLIAGVGREWAPGVVFDLTWEGEEARPAGAPSTAEDRVARFRALASRAAQRLASAFSASPVSSLGVLRFLRRDLLPGASPFAEAEVLLGGLLHVKREEARWDAGASLPLRFHDGVRALLQDTAVAGDVLRVLAHAANVADTGVGPTFTSWLNNPSSGAGQLDPEGSTFAAAAAQMLARLGGRYAEIVKPAPVVAEGGIGISLGVTAEGTVGTPTDLSVETQTWPGDRAVLLVHGVGSGQSKLPPVLDQVREQLGGQADRVAIYEIQLDHIDDWVATKSLFSQQLATLIDALTRRIGDSVYGSVAAQTIADLIWPVLSAPMRAAARELLLAQLRQIVKDGTDAGVAPRDQSLSIISHSSGCFHTYEALHHAASTPGLGLQPGTHGVRFENVVFVASPVQIIRTLFQSLGELFDNRQDVYAVRGTSLSIPAQADAPSNVVPSVKRWTTITGALDPIGGFFLRKVAPWAYMQVAGQVQFIDDQSALAIDSPKELADRLRNSLRPGRSPVITPRHPHCWEDYLERYEEKVPGWLAGDVSVTTHATQAATTHGDGISSGPHSLPAPDVFVGRQDQLGRLDAWAGGGGVPRMMALIGPAGIGKSAIAQRTVAQWLERSPDDGPFVWCFQRDPSTHESFRALQNHLLRRSLQAGEDWEAVLADALSRYNTPLVVFDGLDGISDPSELGSVLSTAELIMSKGARVLLTIRDAMPEARIRMFVDTVDVGPLRNWQMEQLALKLMEAAAASPEIAAVLRPPEMVRLVQELSGGNPAVAEFLVNKGGAFPSDVLVDELARGTRARRVIGGDELEALEDVLTRVRTARDVAANARALEQD
ncbi:MAG: SAV_2336 N-terminal domain-related protein, partial [Gemmatimonadaceae bacterium]